MTESKPEPVRLTLDTADVEWLPWKAEGDDATLIAYVGLYRVFLGHDGECWGWRLDLLGEQDERAEMVDGANGLVSGALGKAQARASGFARLLSGLVEGVAIRAYRERCAPEPSDAPAAEDDLDPDATPEPLDREAALAAIEARDDERWSARVRKASPHMPGGDRFGEPSGTPDAPGRWRLRDQRWTDGDVVWLDVSVTADQNGQLWYAESPDRKTMVGFEGLVWGGRCTRGGEQIDAAALNTSAGPALRTMTRARRWTIKWEPRDAWIGEPRRASLDFVTRDLLAVIHRDGGHHTDKVGLARSLKDAMAIVVKLRADHEQLEGLLGVEMADRVRADSDRDDALGRLDALIVAVSAAHPGPRGAALLDEVTVMLAAALVADEVERPPD